MHGTRSVRGSVHGLIRVNSAINQTRLILFLERRRRRLGDCSSDPRGGRVSSEGGRQPGQLVKVRLFIIKAEGRQAILVLIDTTFHELTQLTLGSEKHFMVPALVVDTFETPYVELLTEALVFFCIEELGQEDLFEFLLLDDLERSSTGIPATDGTEVFALLFLNVDIGKEAKELGGEVVLCFRGSLAVFLVCRRNG
jgi:hypothetical protein